MPLLPNAGTPVFTAPFADGMIPIDMILTVADTAEDFAVAPVSKKIMSVSLINEGPGVVYIRPDADATTSPSNSAKIKVGEAYWDSGISIDKLSFIGDTGLQPHLRGVAWFGIT